MDNSTVFGNFTLPSNSTCGEQINTDVSGIGVRVSLYASVTIGLVMMKFSADMEAFQDAARTSFITSTAVIISALVSLYKGAGLALVDALVVTTVTSLIMAYAFTVGSQGTGYSTRIAKGKFQLTVTLLLATILHTALWSAFGIIVWLNPDGFGNDAVEGCPNPNDGVIFWVVGYSLPATNARLRTFAIWSFATGGVVGLVWVTLSFIITRYAVKQIEENAVNQTQGREEDLPGNLRDMALLASNGPPPSRVASFHTAEESTNGGAGEEHKYPPTTQHADAEAATNQAKASIWAINLPPAIQQLVPIWKFASGLGGIAAYLYLIITTELLISANGQRSATSTLTFGQILSLVLLLDQIIFQPMTQMFNVLYERALKKQKKEKEEKEKAERIAKLELAQGGGLASIGAPHVASSSRADAGT